MLKKLITLSALVFLLNGCDVGPKQGSDGYTFGKPQYVKEQVQIKTVLYGSNAELQTAAKSMGVKNPDIVAFSVLKAPFDVCTIHMVDPTIDYTPEFIGHEFAHCLYGQWHTNNASRN